MTASVMHTYVPRDGAQVRSCLCPGLWLGWYVKARPGSLQVSVPVEILSMCPHVLFLGFLKDEFLVCVFSVCVIREVAAFQAIELPGIGRISWELTFPLCQGSVLPLKYFRKIPFQEKLVVTEIFGFLLSC